MAGREWLADTVISVLLPSRGNPALLERSVRSLRGHASRRLEILVAADDDDPDTARKAGELAVLRLIRKRAGYDRLHVYYQDLAAMASGDWLLVWGDDCVMTTDGWDDIIESLPSGVLVADLASTHSQHCCFPAVRRAAVEAIGMFSTDNPHVDTFWGDIATEAGVIRRPDGIFVQAESVIRGNPHDFYSPEHQEKMRECARLLAAAQA